MISGFIEMDHWAKMRNVVLNKFKVKKIYPHFYMGAN